MNNLVTISLCLRVHAKLPLDNFLEIEMLGSISRMELQGQMCDF